MPSLASSPPSGCVSLMISLLPLTFTPEAVFALLVEDVSCAPTMSAMNSAAGDCMSGFSARLIANCEVRRRHGLAVAELEARLDRDRVGLAVLRDDREADCGLGLDLAAPSGRLVRIVVELERRRVLDLPRDRAVGERRIGEVDVRADMLIFIVPPFLA